ncbi:MAG: HAD-IA family hydrolase [Flavobacterium sp.]|nr:HAD-IA family hydrolase [Pedobacter sp.]
MSVKLVVFDIAGTTVKDNNNVSEAFQSALQKYKVNVEIEKINPLMGYEKKLAIGEILRAHSQLDEFEITSALIDLIYTEFVQLMISYYQDEKDISALPDVEQTLWELQKRGIKVGINTGFPHIIAETIIKRLRWREKGLIDYLIGSDQVEFGRPHPLMIQHIMKELNITDPNEVVKVGDTEVDIREGQEANCKYVIGVTTGTFSRSELKKYNPTHIIDNISEILPILTNEHTATEAL